MLSTVYTCGARGIDGYVVTVECNAANTLPFFEIVGLPDAAIKESKERINAAVSNSGLRSTNAVSSASCRFPATYAR